jgi:hypothetical protein
MMENELFNSDDLILLSYGNVIAADFWLNRLDSNREDKFINIGPEFESSLLVRIENNIEILDRFYLLKGINKIKQFVESNDFIIFPLLKIYDYIQDIFSIEDKPRLEVCGDPEEEYQGLFIIVKTNLPPEQSVDLLERLDEKWSYEWGPEIRTLIGIDITDK